MYIPLIIDNPSCSIYLKLTIWASLIIFELLRHCPAWVSFRKKIHQKMSDFVSDLLNEIIRMTLETSMKLVGEKQILWVTVITFLNSLTDPCGIDRLRIQPYGISNGARDILFFRPRCWSKNIFSFDLQSFMLLWQRKIKRI